MALLLDTTVLIDALRGRAASDQLRSLRRVGEVPFVCVMSVEELARGMRPDELERTHRLVEGLRLAPLGVEQGRRAGGWRQSYASRGVTLGQADCLIAAAAHGVGARLATGNPRDFPMDEIQVEYWEVGA